VAAMPNGSPKSTGGSRSCRDPPEAAVSAWEASSRETRSRAPRAVARACAACRGVAGRTPEGRVGRRAAGSWRAGCRGCSGSRGEGDGRLLKRLRRLCQRGGATWGLCGNCIRSLWVTVVAGSTREWKTVNKTQPMGVMRNAQAKHTTWTRCHALQ
jgi:hypothetical protein